MGLPCGKTIPLSPARRFMCDLMHFSRKVPLVAIESRLQLAPLVEARARLTTRPSWFALFVKAWGLVAEKRAELRRVFLTFPYARIHQYPFSIANLTVARKVGDEDAVLTVHIRHPETMSIAELDAFIARTRTEPVETFGDFRRILRISRFPTLIRRGLWWLALHASGAWRARFAGTFGISSIGALGSSARYVLSPMTATLSYGTLEPDGSLEVRLFYDHRVLDGVQPAAALRELEKVLLGPIRDELLAGGGDVCRAA